MKFINIFKCEWKHFIRSPFKIIATFIFCIAAIYGLLNGSNLYKEQTTEIHKINKQVNEEQQRYLAQFKEGNMSIKNRPWVDLSSPFWAILYSPSYQYKMPSKSMVYSIGQAEQYGYYKKISFSASPYDADLTQEITNPERLQIGTLDFVFVIIYLLPLLLLLLLYNIKSEETEQDILPLIEVQTGTKNTWLSARLFFYFVFSLLVCSILILYGATLTQVLKDQSYDFLKVTLYTFLYIFFWFSLYFIVVKNGKSILSSTLQMIGLWLLFTFIIPGMVHQLVSINKPANLMTDLIDADRDKKQALYNLPDSIFQKKLNVLYPEILESPIYNDTSKRNLAMNRSAYALVNQLKKASVKEVESDNKDKNTLIQKSFWYNPISFFQNKFNHISKTHYSDYQEYREKIQKSIDKRIDFLIRDIWNDIKVDEEKYIEYNSKLK